MDKPIFYLDPEGEILNFDGRDFYEITPRAYPQLPPRKFYISLDGIMYNANKKTFSTGYRCPAGYVRFDLYLNGTERIRTSLHVILARVFRWQPDCYELEVNHIDGNPANNTLENLELVTSAQNTRHAFATGLIHCVGEENPGAKTTESQVRALCEYMTNGEDHSHESYESLGQKFGMTEAMVVHILIVGDTWRKVASEYGFPQNYVKRSANYERFTDEEIHKMCEIFVRLKGHKFAFICNVVVSELGYQNHPNMPKLKDKIKQIYYRHKGNYVRITSNYDY